MNYKFQNIYANLVVQFEKLYKHSRQGSIRTKHRYKEAFFRLLAFLAENFHLEKVANIAPKHIRAYADHLIEKGRTVAYTKTELSAIRFFHDQLPFPKYEELPNNQELGLGKRQVGSVDRTWSSRAFEAAISIATEQMREDYVAILYLARYAALRLHECFRLNTHDAERAIKIGKLTVKGKGGLVREVPINESIEIELKKMLAMTLRGHKLFVKSDDKTHLAMHRLESFLNYYRPRIQDPGSTRPLHFHGLRHTCAAEWYQEFLAQGLEEKQARLKVAKLLGHGRISVTKIYTASVKKNSKGGGTDGC